MAGRKKTMEPKQAMKKITGPRSPKNKPRASDHLMESVGSPSKSDAIGSKNNREDRTKDSNTPPSKGTSFLAPSTGAFLSTGFMGSNQLRDFYGTPSKKARAKPSTPKKPAPMPKKPTPVKRLNAPKKKTTAMKRLKPKTSNSDDASDGFTDGPKRSAKPSKFSDVEKLYQTSKDSRYAHLFDRDD
ncbi:hypothetical protein M426DRAFT_17647 [Hypoxylon sp. CI-4A]|nr:hypothetical protein M426DRAFT_17647 [Hypoxylon sp. CI-4A]